jgi:hypothetical protein
MSAIDRIEGVINWGSDQDWAWWPFLAFRPKQTDVFSKRLVLAGSLVITIFAYGIVMLQRVATDRPVSLLFALVVTLIVFVLTYTWSSLVAYCWNRRMLRLTDQPDWASMLSISARTSHQTSIKTPITHD